MLATMSSLKARTEMRWSSMVGRDIWCPKIVLYLGSKIRVSTYLGKSCSLHTTPQQEEGVEKDDDLASQWSRQERKITIDDSHHSEIASETTNVASTNYVQSTLNTGRTGEGKGRKTNKPTNRPLMFWFPEVADHFEMPAEEVPLRRRDINVGLVSTWLIQDAPQYAHC